jgi:hypothetical protein
MCVYTRTDAYTCTRTHAHTVGQGVVARVLNTYVHAGVWTCVHAGVFAHVRASDAPLISEPLGLVVGERETRVRGRREWMMRRQESVRRQLPVFVYIAGECTR